mgnify:CR=1 FL=1
MKLDWEKIKGNVIHCDTEEKAKELLNVCSNHGCDTQYVEDTWKNYRDIMCYEINIEREDIYYGSIDYFINEEHREVLEFEDIIIQDKPRICEILGVELEQKFNIKGYNYSSPFYLKKEMNDNIFLYNRNGISDNGTMLVKIINNPSLIEIMPKYTTEQKAIFKALKTLGYSYMARDSDYTTYAYELKPEKCEYDWHSTGDTYMELETSKILNAPHLNFIKWEDDDPFEIPELD